MSNERTTKTITTPSGKVVVMYDYITGREIQKATTENPGETSAEQLAQSNALLSLVLRSIDGVTEDLLNVALDMPFTDFASITEAMQEMINVKKN